ncbi:MAG: glycerophosphodiester phosphodiesterase [Pseudomonadales bacterium]|nr:glycerophosphodiester phosphodiesterase [Pseudomonadales bacterium]
MQLTPTLVLGFSVFFFGCQAIDVGERPAFLIASLTDEALKEKLSACSAGPFHQTDFVIAHRGAPLGYPEHTAQGYKAAADMGAGFIECDVTFTQDGTLVCRHSQCDLHRTTNILATPLAQKCRTPFTPASSGSDADASCCTSDISLQDFQSLCGRPDHVNKRANDITEYLRNPTPRVYAHPVQCGTLQTLSENITYIEALGAKHVPELKAPMVPMPHNGMSQQAYADRMIQAFYDAEIPPDRIYPQSFSLDDVLYWIKSYPEIADQVVFLDPRGRDRNFSPSIESMQALYDQGLRILAPPMPMLLHTNEDGRVVPSVYARLAKQAGFKLITWTFESGVATEPNNWLYATSRTAIQTEGDSLALLHVLQQEVGIEGIFTDWAGTVTYYANCLGID